MTEVFLKFIFYLTDIFISIARSLEFHGWRASVLWHLHLMEDESAAWWGLVLTHRHPTSQLQHSQNRMPSFLLSGPALRWDGANTTPDGIRISPREAGLWLFQRAVSSLVFETVRSWLRFTGDQVPYLLQCRWPYYFMDSDSGLSEGNPVHLADGCLPDGNSSELSRVLPLQSCLTCCGPC